MLAIVTVVNSPLADALRDRCLLERELGRGGMATVYLARDQSLRDRLRHESRLPVDEAVRIACEAAQALQYAHEHGVADFGIARALGGGDERLTDAGRAIGTPQSMSPEQATAER